VVREDGVNDGETCRRDKKLRKMKNKKPTRCHFLFYCTSYRLNMFRTLLAHHQQLATMMLFTILVVSFLVCCMLEVSCG